MKWFWKKFETNITYSNSNVINISSYENKKAFSPFYNKKYFW